ncbi:hypothetical protein OG331_49970 [Streptomyces sp. NBC_01017]|nr:hypothetical protein OG331_02005 [Streptomyces sp. NBC_01017]WSV35087.1 hypothetical protein OG331_49970 [Streptomyces sp. NBC_01017]
MTIRFTIWNHITSTTGMSATGLNTDHRQPRNALSQHAPNVTTPPART